MEGQQHKPPPLGIKPRWLVYEHRLSEILYAIKRYNDRNISIPDEWLQERDFIIDFLINRNP